MSPVDVPAAGPVAAHPSVPPSGPSGPPSGVAPTGPIDFAQALVDAQASDTSEMGGGPGDAASAVPEWGAVREARGDARLAVWLAMGRVAAHATASSPTPAFGDATKFVSARDTEVGEPNAAADPAASPADHDLGTDVPASFVLPVPGRIEWSMPLSSPGLPQNSSEELEVPSDRTFVRIGSERPPVEPPDTAAEPPASAAAARVTGTERGPNAAAPQLPGTVAPQGAPGETATSLPHALDLGSIELPRAPGEVRRIEHHATLTTSPLTAERDEWPSRATLTEPHAAVHPMSQHASIEVGAAHTAASETATSERPTEVAAPSQQATKTAPTARAEVRAIEQPTVAFSNSAPRPASEERQDLGTALTAKRPRQAYGPMPEAWFPTQAGGSSVPIVTSPPIVVVPTAVVHAEAPDADDLRSQIVQAMRVQWTGASGDARIRLQPHYLGELTISLRVEQGVVSAQLTASSPEVRQWIEANEGVLRLGLAQHDLKLERLVVANDEPAAAPQDEQESESREHQPPKRRSRRQDTDATFEVIV